MSLVFTFVQQKVQCQGLGETYVKWPDVVFIYRWYGVYTGSGRNIWRFGNSCEWNCWRGEFVLESSSSETQSISVANERWSVEHRAFAVETYLKKTNLSWLRGYFVGTSIFIGTSVPSRNTSSSGDISRARCTKRNQRQRWIWNRTSGKKWQQFLPTCCNEWCRTSRNVWGNVLTTRDATSQTLHSGIIIKIFWVKDNFSDKFT